MMWNLRRARIEMEMTQKELDQIETKMIESLDGCSCICLDKQSRFSGWKFYRHPDGQWVTERLAFPVEILRAKVRLDQLEAMAGIPCRP